MSSTSDIRQTFFQECDDLLEALNDGLADIDETVDSSVDPEVVNAVFRAVHSIKGGAAAFGLKALVSFAHTFENTLDDLRSNRIQLSDDLVRLCHRAADHLSDLVRASREGVEPAAGSGDEIGRKLAEACAGGKGAAPAEDEPEVEFTFEPMVLSFGDAPPLPEPQGTNWTIRFRPLPGLLESGNDPVHLFRELATLGQLTSVCDLDAIPILEDLDPEDLLPEWDLALTTETEEAQIGDIFDFVTGLCRLKITRDQPPAPAAAETGAAETSTGASPVAAAPSTGAPPQAGEEAKGGAGDAAAKTAATKASTNNATVRVDLDLVDRLINMVGELVINQAVLAQCVQDAGISTRGQLMTSLTDLRNLTREIQENVMAIRAQPVKPLFQRMARIVRDASEMAGKTAHFQTLGETTEVDKTVIEQLVDPLTHMIRNSIDHGLEPAETRKAAGKPPTGTVTLSAAHRSGRVVIEVSDDGSGINRPKVLEIAKRKGLVPQDADLTDNEIDNLLFLPGFSTASTITNLSGRGVGMDVVKSAIRKLGGRVSIASAPGQGTTMSISLPLTLAVLDGMVVDVAGQTMVVPITAIIETLRPTAETIHELGATGRVVKVRDRFIPVIDLGYLFGHCERGRNVVDMVLLLVETDAKETFALAVDRIFDQRQIVIKGLETNYGHVPCVAAATILGDGKIALIIDPEETAAMGRSGAGLHQREQMEASLGHEA